MQKSTTGTLRSQNALLATQNRTVRQQRTATSNRTGGLSSSAQTSSAHKVIEKQKPRIFDEFNSDVTPKPLFEQETSQKTRHGSALFHSIEGTSTPTDMLSNGSILNTNAILTTAQSFGAFPETSTHVSSDSTQVPSDSVQDNAAGASNDKDKENAALFYINVEKASKKDPKTANINLSETQTFVLLDFPAICVSSEDSSVDLIKQKNQKYAELCKNKSGNDSYADRGINTFNDPPKIKSTQTEKLTINDKGVFCTAWDMYDSFNGAPKKDSDDLANLLGKNEPDKQSTSSDDKSQNKTKINSSETGTVASETSTTLVKNSALIAKELKRIQELKSNYQQDANFKLNLFYMERLLNLNTYQSKQARYRNLRPLNILDDALKEQQNSKLALQQYDGLSLEKLWTYSCSLTKERNVSCLVWNKKNKDILAAGYGKFEFNDDPSGLVCCWSLKNPEFPERYYKTDAGVSALAFSHKHSNLLAVGLFNGNILVFDVRNNNTIPLISTNESEHKHLSPVWNLKWTDKDRASSNGESDEMEVLMSISSDGRVTQWMIRKGFESSDYLKLKRVTNKGEESKKDKEKTDGLISRHSGGLCFDIWDQDKSIYLCGTEEGYVHRCSTSYNEQYLDTYYGHTGPVYKLSWSPFLKNCFLSASADWTIRLWKINRQTPCLTFNSSSKSVFDICWSNHSATLFCCVNENYIELWDLSKSTLDPIYSTSSIGSTKLTSISYSPNSDSLVVGTNDGNLYIYAIKNLPQPTKENDLEDLIKQSLISQLETVSVDDEETKEMMEKHQLESLQTNEKSQEDDLEDDQKNKFDAFEAKLDKIKSENEAILQGKSVHKNKSKSKNGAQNEPKDDSSSDEN